MHLRIWLVYFNFRVDFILKLSSDRYWQAYLTKTLATGRQTQASVQVVSPRRLLLFHLLFLLPVDYLPRRRLNACCCRRSGSHFVRARAFGLAAVRARAFGITRGPPPSSTWPQTPFHCFPGWQPGLDASRRDKAGGGCGTAFPGCAFRGGCTASGAVLGKASIFLGTGGARTAPNGFGCVPVFFQNRSIVFIACAMSNCLRQAQPF